MSKEERQIPEYIFRQLMLLEAFTSLVPMWVDSIEEYSKSEKPVKFYKHRLKKYCNILRSECETVIKKNRELAEVKANIAEILKEKKAVQLFMDKEEVKAANKQASDFAFMIDKLLTEFIEVTPEGNIIVYKSLEGGKND